MKTRLTEYFLTLIGIIFYFLAINIINKIINMQISDILSGDTTFLIYGIISTIFLSLTIVVGLYIKYKLLRYVYATILLFLALIFSVPLLLKITFAIIPICLFQEEPNKIIQSIKVAPIFVVLLYSLLIYLQGPNAIKNYVNTMIIEPSIKFTDNLIEQFTNASYNSIAYQQKEIFLKGYDTALHIVYGYAIKTNQEEVIDILRVLNEYRDNISKTYDMEIEKNRSQYIIQSKNNIIQYIRDIFNRYLVYVFAATILLMYSIINAYFTIILVLVHAFVSLFKIKMREY
ncbi:MAG TPA: hypothetical protein EYH09_01320 [Candidatus Nanopusillus sp.]|nr:hypothetical protein [Candidatus Nanopusillus sp.]HIP90130.1 hypothetical protein [Candidatus Nanopusillus sp.]